MSLSCSGEQKEQFENPFEVLAQLEFYSMTVDFINNDIEMANRKNTLIIILV